MQFTLIFPGQGSQAPGMGRFLFDNFSICKETFEEASEAIKLDLKKLCFESSEADLALTENTQPALLTVSTATQRVLRNQFGVVALAGAGHSIGEYAAVVAAGSMSFADAVRAVRIRGQAMQSAVPVGMGAMAAVMGSDEVQIKDLCEWAVKSSGVGPLSPANFNSPGQIVISGSKACVDWLKENIKSETSPEWAKKLKLIPLQVSAPFHCEMMKPAEDKMREVLAEMRFQDAHFPIIQNFTAKAHQKGADIRENLVRQVSASVLWMQSIQTAKQSNYLNYIECGHGKVLAGLLKKIDSETLRVMGTNSLEDIENIEKLVKN
jgi:[acyl-carrier-protein] S-malonyltransferase